MTRTNWCLHIVNKINIDRCKTKNKLSSIHKNTNLFKWSAKLKHVSVAFLLYYESTDTEYFFLTNYASNSVQTQNYQIFHKEVNKSEYLKLTKYWIHTITAKGTTSCTTEHKKHVLCYCLQILRGRVPPPWRVPVFRLRTVVARSQLGPNFGRS